MERLDGSHQRCTASVVICPGPMGRCTGSRSVWSSAGGVLPDIAGPRTLCNSAVAVRAIWSASPASVNDTLTRCPMAIPWLGKRATVA